MRGTFVVLLGLCFSSDVMYSLRADEPPAAAVARDSPIQVLKESLTAARSRDFVRYVDALAPEEQAVQAGCAAYIASMYSLVGTMGGEIGQEPKEILTMRLFEDVKSKHFVPEEDRTPEQQKLAELPGEMLGRAFAVSLMEAGLEVTPSSDTYGAMLFGPMGAMRNKYRDYSKLIKSPRQFLVDLLTRLSEPVEVTSAGETQVQDDLPSELDQMLTYLESVEWTLYRRGDYALAAPTEAAPTEISNNSAEGEPENLVGEAPNSGEESILKGRPLLVEFRLIDKQWKIQQLLPEWMLSGPGSGPGPRAIVPASAATAPNPVPPWVAPASSTGLDRPSY